MGILSVTWLLKADKFDHSHGIHTGDELRSGSAGNDAGGVPFSVQRLFFLSIP